MHPPIRIGKLLSSTPPPSNSLFWPNRRQMWKMPPHAWSLLKQLLAVAGCLWSGSSTSDICLITYFRVQFPQSKMTYVIQCHMCKNGHTRIGLVRNPPTHGLASVAYHITNRRDHGAVPPKFIIVSIVSLPSCKVVAWLFFGRCTQKPIQSTRNETEQRNHAMPVNLVK